MGARTGAAGGRRATPFVLTVHDRSWEERPQDFTRYERLWHAAARPRRLARRAARVLCDTEVVRGALIREWGLDPGRVRTVPLAPRRLPGASSPSSHPYFLSVGALEPRKAPDVLVAGFRLARERGLEAELIVAGDGRVNVEAPGVRRLGHVEDLGSLYAGALAVVLPSWIEGFGLHARRGHRRGHARDRRATSRCCARCSATARSTCSPATPPGSPTRCSASRATRSCASAC